MEQIPLTDEMRQAMNDTALEDFAALIAMLQHHYGLVTHPGDDGRGFAYHWHDMDGTCHAEDTHEGFANITEAILAGVEELLFVERLNGMGPLVMALMNAGMDLSSVVVGLNTEENEGIKVRELTKAVKTGMEAITEAGRKQPTGFQGQVVASFLTLAREIVRICGNDARAALGQETQLPIPAFLPAGHVAVPAVMVAMFERTLQEIDGTGGPQNESPTPIANAA
jgi:hypothetical protein